LGSTFSSPAPFTISHLVHTCGRPTEGKTLVARYFALKGTIASSPNEG